MRKLLASALLAGMMGVAGCAWGQGQPAPKPKDSISFTHQRPIDAPIAWVNMDSPKVLHIATGFCDGSLKMGNSTRAVKDVFKDECNNKHAKIIMDGDDATAGKPFNFKLPPVWTGAIVVNGDSPPKGVRSGITGECDDPGGSAKVNFGKDLRLQDWQPGVDIVGGQGQKQLDGFGHACGAYPCDPPEDVPAIRSREGTLCGGDTVGMCSTPSFKWVCADRSRVLETAENGDKWCRKPQSR
jgi:hypothetical protein